MVRNLLFERQEGLCPACGEPLDLKSALQIHHRDGNSRNQQPSNLALLHDQCHAIPGRPQLSVGPAREDARARVDLEDDSQTRRVSREIGPAGGSPEFQANRRFEVPFRDFVFAVLRSEGVASFEELVYSGAEKVGCQPARTREYLKKMTSRSGPLREERSPEGVVVLLKTMSGGSDRD